ncbi:hypothetical protein FSW04_19340 [Baekduia soli]|uniref:Beta-glucuronidase C-terminal domain-containing protein n=1 Tax=Baekduia soli TaxID=496014 RepID=A0A5B8U9N2_9ACTN|nr:glycosyl hydrolase family 79 C-terminal domain-containing protein [Baekduia soli]QEC49508.1 hypothetical protein FSW04_19340 [Baekduia soli]
MIRPSLLAVLAAVLVALAAPAASPARLPLQVGIADDAALFADRDTAAGSVAAWKRAGIDTVRIQVSWSRVAPDPQAAARPEGFQAGNPEDPGYHWGYIDQAVDLVTAAGLTPILMIDGPPPLWASSAPARRNPRYRPRATEFGPFATAVARRYGDRVDQYILWNEPNLPLWLQPQAECGSPKTCSPVSGDLYRSMVREAYQPMHDADPGAVVLIGALAPAGGNLTSTNATMRPLQFLRALACVDTKLHPVFTGRCANFRPAVADGIAYHAHSTRNAPDEPYANRDDADLASLSRVERLLDQLQQRGRLWGSTSPLNLWLDEYGYQTNPPDKARGVSMARQDRYLQQAAYLAWRNPRVKLLGQYLWNDEPVGGGRKYTGWQSGLIAANGRSKPALDTFPSPMWIDAARSTIWGQMRPGDDHVVSVQLRMPGNATEWQDVGDIPTAPDGTWTLQTGLVPYGSYRAVAEDGEVTDTMVATPATATTGTGGAVTKERTAAGVLVERRAVGTTPGVAVPPSFAGFSIEYWSALDYLGAFGQVNPAFAQLARTLAHGGRGAPTIRLGGNSTDGTWWNPDGVPRPPGIDTDLTVTWLQQLKTWTAATRTPMVLGVNLGLDDPANAAAYVQQAVGTLGPGALAGFEIGNEPDRYSQLRTFHVGTRKLERVERRPPDYSFARYSDELDAYVRTLAPLAGGVGLSGGAFAGSIWDPETDALLGREGPGTTAFGAHAYALEACGAAARNRKKASFARALLAPGGSAPILARMGQLTSVATAHGAAFRVSETNSANCGGVNGVSNAFASALWGTDLLFGLAQAGVSNVDFHSWNGAYYSPVDFVHSKGALVARVHPLFYGMLLFNRALPAGARLLPVAPNSPQAALKTWASVDPAGTRRIVVINKDSGRPRQVVLRVPGGARAGRVERLSAPSVLSKDGVTFAGQTYGRTTADGRLTGRRVVEPLRRAGGAFRLYLPAGSAALVTVPRGGG